MQGANRQISERRDPRTAEIRLASAKRSPQTALPTLFTKPPAHTFASGATQHLGCRPSLRLMVRTYIRKGGHGGDRSKAGLPAALPARATGRRRVASNICFSTQVLTTLSAASL